MDERETGRTSPPDSLRGKLDDLLGAGEPAPETDDGVNDAAEVLGEGRPELAPRRPTDPPF